MLQKERGSPRLGTGRVRDDPQHKRVRLASRPCLFVSAYTMIDVLIDPWAKDSNRYVVRFLGGR